MADYKAPIYVGKYAEVKSHDLGYCVVDFHGRHIAYIANLDVAKKLADTSSEPVVVAPVVPPVVEDKPAKVTQVSPVVPAHGKLPEPDKKWTSKQS